MSVIESLRNESKTQYVYNARELSKFTDDRCRNFPNRWNVSYSQRLRYLSMHIYSLVFEANNLNVHDDEEYENRTSNLKKAKRCLYDMVALISVASEKFPICGYLKPRKNETKEHLANRQSIKSDRYMEKWMSYIDYELNLIKKVMSSDKMQRRRKKKANRKISKLKNQNL